MKRSFAKLEKGIGTAGRLLLLFAPGLITMLAVTRGHGIWIGMMSGAGVQAALLCSVAFVVALREQYRRDRRRDKRPEP